MIGECYRGSLEFEHDHFRVVDQERNCLGNVFYDIELLMPDGTINKNSIEQNMLRQWIVKGVTERISTQEFDERQQEMIMLCKAEEIKRKLKE